MRLSKFDQTLLEKGYYPVQLAADRMRLHFTTVYRLLRDGALQSTKFRKKHYIHVDAMQEYLGKEAAELLDLVPHEGSAVRASEAPTLRAPDVVPVGAESGS